jgi:capsular polysaccharide transport system permease protein
MPDETPKPSPSTLEELLEEAAQRRGRRRDVPSKVAGSADNEAVAELADREASEAVVVALPAGSQPADAPPSAAEAAPRLDTPAERYRSPAQVVASVERGKPEAGLAPLAILQFGNDTRAPGGANTRPSGEGASEREPPTHQPGDEVVSRGRAEKRQDRAERAQDARDKIARRDQPADRHDRQGRSKVGGRERALQRPALEATPIEFPPLPMPVRRKSRGEFLSFLVVVVLPVLVATGYYFFIASKQYVSEFKFVVRDAMSASMGSKDTSMGDVMAMAGGSRANSLESYMVTEFIKSQKAVEELQARIDIRKLYSRPEIDWFGRFDEEGPIEAFTAYWDRKVSAQFDMLTGIGTARVRAYRPEDAHLISSTVLSMSEELINNVATRPQRDAVRSAEAELKKAESRLAVLSARLSQFRNTELVIDPASNVVMGNAQLAQALRIQLAQYQTELAALKQLNLDQNAPMSRVLQSRIKATRDQLATVEGEVAVRGGANALSKVMGEYEQIDLERQFAQESVKAAMKTLDEARSSAVFQHMYVTPFVSPSMPQSSTFPNRLSSIAIVAFVSLLVWTAGLLFVRSVREHLS